MDHWLKRWTNHFLNDFVQVGSNTNLQFASKTALSYGWTLIPKCSANFFWPGRVLRIGRSGPALKPHKPNTHKPNTHTITNQLISCNKQSRVEVKQNDQPFNLQINCSSCTVIYIYPSCIQRHVHFHFRTFCNPVIQLSQMYNTQSIRVRAN